MTKTEKFTHNDREFEIRAAVVDHGVEAKSFYNGKPIATYAATYETAAALHQQGWGSVMENLIAFARADIEHNQLPGLRAVFEAAQV